MSESPSPILRLVFHVAAICLTAALAACAPPVEESPAATKPPPSPKGAIWAWTTLSGGETLTVDAPDRYTLELLDEGRYAFRANCNTGGGYYTIEGDRISLAPGPVSLAACPPGSHGDRFASLLGQAAGYAREGARLTLELSDGAGTLEFEEMKPMSLTATTWSVRSYNNGKAAVVSVASGTKLNTVFSGDGRLSGSAGCNNYRASYEIDGEGLSIGPAAATRKMCAGEGVMEQETAFLQALTTVATWEIRGERLQLRTADGALAVDLYADTAEETD
jgi:heat shock protein HslJ